MAPCSLAEDNAAASSPGPPADRQRLAVHPHQQPRLPLVAHGAATKLERSKGQGETRQLTKDNLQRPLPAVTAPVRARPIRNKAFGKVFTKHQKESRSLRNNEPKRNERQSSESEQIYLKRPSSQTEGGREDPHACRVTRVQIYTFMSCLLLPMLFFKMQLRNAIDSNMSAQEVAPQRSDASEEAACQRGSLPKKVLCRWHKQEAVYRWQRQDDQSREEKTKKTQQTSA